MGLQGKSEPGKIRFDRTTWGLIAILILVIGGIFSGVKNCSFIGFDDEVYVTNNPHVRTGLSWENFAWAWRMDNRAGFWLPLTWVSLQLDATLSGPETPKVATTKPRIANAPPPLSKAPIYHFHNLLLHIMAAAILFLFLYRATKLRGAAFAVTLLWAIHPLRVESVAWVTERKDVLAAVYGFLAMYLYVVWAGRGRWQWYAGVCVASGLSLMAKPMFVTLPFVLVLLDAWPLGRIACWRDVARRIGEKWVLLIMAGSAAAAAFIAQAQVHATKTLEQLGLWMRIEHAVISYVTYLVRQVQMWDLAVFYPYGNPPEVAELIACVALLGGITGLCIWQCRRRAWLLVGWLWYLGTMLPMIGIVQSGEQGYADRFTYLPAVGLGMMVVFGIEEIWRSRTRWRPALAGLGTAVTLVLLAITWRQVGYWQDTITLCERTLQVTENNLTVHGTLAAAYLREGENDKALAQYREAVAIDPTFGPAWASMGALELELGHVEDAVRSLTKAAMLDKTNPLVRYHRGLALERAGLLDAAIYEFHVTLQLNHNNPEAARRLEAAEAAKRRVTETRVK